MPQRAADLGGEKISGERVDEMIASSAFFSLYLMFKTLDVQVSGRVHAHPAASFMTNAIEYVKTRRNPVTTEVYTAEEAADFAESLEAYQHAGEIHLREDRGDPATTVHEAMHLYSSPEFFELGVNVNEGATEYFTRKLCDEHDVPRGDYYSDEYKAVKALVEFIALALSDGGA